MASRIVSIEKTGSRNFGGSPWAPVRLSGVDSLTSIGLLSMNFTTIDYAVVPRNTHLLPSEALTLVLSAGAASAAWTVLRLLLAMPRCTSPYHAPPEIAMVSPRMASHDLASPMKMMLIATTTTWRRPGEGVRRAGGHARS